MTTTLDCHLGTGKPLGECPVCRGITCVVTGEVINGRYWDETDPDELWHLIDAVDGERTILAEIQRKWYLGTPKHYVITGRPEQYKTLSEAKGAAERPTKLPSRDPG